MPRSGAHRGAEHRSGIHLIRLAMAWYIDRIVQTDQQSLRGCVGEENGCEGEVAHTGPFEGPGNRSAPRDLLGRLVLVLATLHGVELRGGKIRQGLLIAKPARPGH